MRLIDGAPRVIPSAERAAAFAALNASACERPLSLQPVLRRAPRPLDGDVRRLNLSAAVIAELMSGPKG
jgi:hypothetical protein